MSSATSSVTPAQIIDHILSTNTSTPDYLQKLVNNINNLLDYYTNKGKQTITDENLASVRAGLPSASQVAKFSDEASKSVTQISTQISYYSGDKHSTAISVLNALGNVHWVGVGFLLVAAVVQRLDKIRQNKNECLQLLKSMNDLAKLILQLQGLPHLKKELNDKMKESIQLIVDGAILCCVQKKKKLPRRLWVAGTDGEQLANLRSQVDEMRSTLHSQISLSNYLHSVCSPPPVPSHDSAVVGIGHKINEVIELLEWDNDKPAVAVVVHGIGGAGKTTLANEVFASLNLQGWKYSKVTLIKNLDLNPNIEEIQSQILSDLTGIKHTVRDFQGGQQELKSVIEKEVVFMHIDNILKREHLEMLLPKLIDSPERKVRILVTARKTNISGVFESCGIKPCKLYAIESLSVEASLEVLCRKINTERDIDSMVEERPQAKEIAEKCSCCPLFLEVVGAYLHKRNNKVEAYEKVICWLREGKDFSCDKEDGFEESRIMFAYNELTPSAQEAFLDICSFFYDWKWNEVACIVGEEELDCLLEGALLKRIEVGSYDGTIERISIHDLILRAGRNKSKGNRYTTVDDFSTAMENERDLQQAKGVWLNDNNKPLQISAKVLDSMSRSLRVFAMRNKTTVRGQCSKRFDELRFVKACNWSNLAVDILKLNNLSFMDYSLKEKEIWSLQNFSGLQVLKLKRSRGTYGGNIHANIEFGHLIKLRHLELEGFHNTEVSSFVKVYGLHKLKLSSIEGLKELPGSIGKLRSLQELHLFRCDNLMRLGEGFGELSSLTVFDLTKCKSLQELPCDLEKLLSLQSLKLSYCPNLLRLPEEIENLPSLKFVDVRGCSKLTSLPQRVCLESLCLVECESLQELCDDIHCLAGLKRLNMSGCKSLSRLPEGFGKLGCLESLELSGCDNIQEFCSDFGCLGALKYLYLSKCKSLSKLPDCFGQLGCLERLQLSGCDNLQELCSDFGCLAALKYLYLSNCKSLSKLPDCFGQVGCLERLHLSGCDNLQELCSDFGCLGALKYLNLSNCKSLSKLPDCFGQLGCLESLQLSRCDNLQELCSNFGCLRALKYLYLSKCKSLSKLPDCFGQLGCLESLQLSGCDNLQELCSDFGCLGALKYLYLSNCKILSKLPDCFGQLGCLERLDLSGCDNIQELCSNFGCLGALKYLHLSKCKSLSKLPDSFGQLGCLERLNLSGCDNIKELCSNFGCLGALKYLYLSKCKSLSKLPDSFGQLGCLDRLQLSGCDNLQDLCSNFGCLGALKYLWLSNCRSLSKLPDCFGQLGCLERLDLSMCSKLEELSSDFNCLRSLIKLDLSNCESLSEKWMDNMGSIQSLWRINISRSEKMLGRWIEMQREKEDWNFVVITDFSWEETEEGRKDLLLKVATLKIFDEGGLLIDIHGRPFNSSSLPPASSLIFIIEYCPCQIDGNLFEKNMQQLELNSRASSIIYAGRHFSALPSEVTERIVAYTPSSSKTSLFFDKMSATFPEIYGRSTSVFKSRVGLEVKAIKCPSVWEDVSYILNESTLLLRAPSESNVEILRAMLQTDFLIKKSQRVKLIDLQGKVILLLNTSLTMSKRRYSAFNDIYIKMQGSHQDLVEVVWIPFCFETERDKFERIAADALWPVVPNPWSIQGSLRHLFSLIEVPLNLSPLRVVVVDGKGRISNKSAWEMIERWGDVAFPFSQGREEELRKSEWGKMCNYNQFVFQNLPFTQTEVKEGSACGEMMLLFVGRSKHMLELSTELEYALTKLKSHFQLYYIWRKYDDINIKIIKEISTIPSISHLEAYGFWDRMKYLYKDLTRMGSDEKIVQMRSMVSGIISAEVGSVKEKQMRVIVIDDNGEMVSGRGKEVVEALLQYIENESKLPTEVNIEGVRQVLQGQGKDGIIYPKHHPQHFMLQLSTSYANPRCTICSKKALCELCFDRRRRPVSSRYYYYQCNVCESHVMCETCMTHLQEGHKF